MALDSPQACETCLDKTPCRPSTYPAPFCQVKGLDTFWPAYARAQRWEMVPHSHFGIIFRGVCDHQFKTLSGIPPSPTICLVPQVCLSSWITLGVFLDSPRYTPTCSVNMGSLMTDCLLLCRESERRAPGLYREDVNYAGNRLALVGLCCRLYPNLRK